MVWSSCIARPWATAIERMAACGTGAPPQHAAPAMPASAGHGAACQGPRAGSERLRRRSEAELNPKPRQVPPLTPCACACSALRRAGLDKRPGMGGTAREGRFVCLCRGTRRADGGARRQRAAGGQAVDVAAGVFVVGAAVVNGGPCLACRIGHFVPVWQPNIGSGTTGACR
jgi:hypothetical protein